MILIYREGMLLKDGVAIDANIINAIDPPEIKVENVTFKCTRTKNETGGTLR